MIKLAIIGASYLQLPLIKKAKEMGIETHVFAWKAGDVGETEADFFYPISIIEKDEILEECKKIKIDGICSIASDLAAITVNYVANKLGLNGNSEECTEISTNKYLMRKAFEEGGDPSPKSILVSSVEDLDEISLEYPVIVKPIDRSGSRGITKLENADGLSEAIECAKEQGFEKKALVEEYVTGDEYSVEYISYHGKHTFLNLTKKYTTGAPHFIETGHIEPATVDEKMLNKIKKIVTHALDTLKIKNSASHTELKISENGDIKLIEIGGRMGGDFIGSDMVYLSTGVDFVKAVIQLALGKEPEIQFNDVMRTAGVRFIFGKRDIEVLEKIKKEHPDYLIYSEIHECEGEITDSASRYGMYLISAEHYGDIEEYMPD